MEKVILELIYKLDDILYGLKTKVYNGNIESIIINCFEPGTKARENEDEITEDDDIPEIIDMLEKELPNMLAYCKNTSISPEVECKHPKFADFFGCGFVANFADKKVCYV